jgi:hypothetical protein
MRIGYNPGMAIRPKIEADPVIEVYKKDIDRTLIRKNLKLTVEERLNQLMKLQEFADELKRSGADARRHR